MGLKKFTGTIGKKYKEDVGVLTSGKLVVDLPFKPSKVIYTIQGQLYGYSYSQTGIISNSTDLCSTGSSITDDIYVKYYSNGDPPFSAVGGSSCNISGNSFTLDAPSVSSTNVRY